jgi:predicted nucleotide-binding protein (sugar kinase/HSP70/actin superfamily)
VRVGLPRALIYHYYYPLWKNLFEQFDVQVVISDITSKELIQKGIKVTVPEICLPIKAFNGHVINLLSKNVDYIFIPRFVGIESKKWFCPKFIGLPELVGYTIDGVKDKMLTIDIHGNREDTCLLENYRPLCNVFNITEKELKKALKKASAYWQEFKQYCMKGFTIEESMQILNGEQMVSNTHPEITLGLLGYVYNIYDPFVSMDIIKRLRQMDVKVITFEMMHEKDIANVFSKKSKSIYWTFSNKIYGAAKVLMNDPEVDGFIHVTAFGCGPDSIIGKLMELDSDKFRKPFMTLRVDEHTGESHLQTRIEAFVDMIKRKKFAEQRRELA